MGVKTLDIIIPTWNNQQFLNPCLSSIVATGVLNDGHTQVLVVNNGDQPVEKDVEGVKGIVVLNPGENLGWEGGLEYALKYSKSEFVCFQNDDTHIPNAAQKDFYQRLMSHFDDPKKKIGAVGPATTVAAGYHSIFRNFLEEPMEVAFLIFFTVMLKRSILDEVGGVDKTLPGGDDLDVSLRLHKAGYKTIIDPAAFIVHHAFQTGTRVRGGPETKGGWNSQEMTDRTNIALIKKHGFRPFIEMLLGGKVPE